MVLCDVCVCYVTIQGNVRSSLLSPTLNTNRCFSYSSVVDLDCVFLFSWCQFHVLELALASSKLTTPPDTGREVKPYSVLVKIMFLLILSILICSTYIIFYLLSCGNNRKHANNVK